MTIFATEKFMRETIRLSIENIDKGGGPFGAVIVKDGSIITGASNNVAQKNDPTAHAEINAIRQAAQSLETPDLSGCEIFCSCEPCPMCLGAIYWARIKKIYYGATRTDAANAGFVDADLYREFTFPPDKRKIPASQLLEDEARQAFRKWDEKEDKIQY